VTARKLLGFLVAILGIAIGAFLSGTTAIILAGYWDAKETGGWDGRINLLAAAVLGALLGYGIYRLGRRIAR
jgi:membrane protein DedA with SNARE-associated domain